MGVRTHWPLIWRASLALLIAAGGAGCQARRPAPAPKAPAHGAFPVTMTDDLGHRVTVKRTPKRIVSLAPNVTEMLYALGLGERIAGVTDFCNYPPAARRKPRIGGYGRPSAERILSVRPDLVIASRGNPLEVLSQIERLGVPVYGADPQTINQVIALARKLGRLTGRNKAGRALARDLAGRVRAIEAKRAGIPKDRRPRVLVVIADQPLSVAGSGTFLDDVIRKAGGRNAAAEYRGFSTLSQEGAAMLAPDVIVTVAPEKDAIERIKRSALGASPAARHGRIHALNEDIISRPGPRVVEALAQIEAVLRPRQGG